MHLPLRLQMQTRIFAPRQRPHAALQLQRAAQHLPLQFIQHKTLLVKAQLALEFF